MPLCATPTQCNCFTSWNTLIDGANGSHWLDKLLPTQRAACTNPLSWRSDTLPAPRTLGRGAMPVHGPLLMAGFDEQLVGARCSEAGMLYVDDPSKRGGWGYIADMTWNPSWGLPRGELHAYDYPL